MKAYIILENGKVFCGERFGADGDVIGEIVFTTGMGGYIETLTDPCYYGQIVMQTFPLIGNYGMISEDCESEKSFVKAYVVREKCDAPSNFRCEKTLEEYLKEQGIVGIYGVDTREITRIIRENGVMNAKIVSELPDDLTAGLKEYSIKDAVKAVCKEESTVSPADGEVKCKVGLLNLGSVTNIADELNKRGCEVTVLPFNASADKMSEFDGIVVSNGPGDPSENCEIIENIKNIFGKKPLWGISLGHQILALAAGGKTEKLKYGHRGANQPVKKLDTGRVYITNQNHGYVVDSNSLPEGATVEYVNVNDGTCEGIEYADKNAFSIQFHPNACIGINDENFLYDKFLNMMGVN